MFSCIVLYKLDLNFSMTKAKRDLKFHEAL